MISGRDLQRAWNRRPGSRLTFKPGPEEKISTKLDRVPLEDAINRLSDNVAVFYAKDPKEQNYRIAKIAVLLKGRERWAAYGW